MSEEQIKIVYVPVQIDSEPPQDNYVEFKSYSKNRLTDKYEICLHMENLAFNPIQAVSQIIRGDRVHTKIMFENGKVIYTPTSYERIKELMKVNTSLMYVKKTETEKI